MDPACAKSGGTLIDATARREKVHAPAHARRNLAENSKLRGRL
jgi:hypothetical protein